jgi:CDP-paratose 2-epimerase
MTSKLAPVLIIGGAGFIGCNLAAYLARAGQRVRIYDDLSRPGVEQNLRWLHGTFGDLIEPHIADVRDRSRLRAAVAGTEAVFHFAAQVAVTTSLVDPVEDFEINARGTIEVLEAIRAHDARPPIIFTSTNKVYGCLPDVRLQVVGDQWTPVDRTLATEGIDERRPLEFRTPYGCSKGAAEQYVLDYAHSFDVPATVFRMSCIYGPHQLGTEDQGWVAHFLLCALDGRPITIYGDGKQVRDILYVDDLVDAFVRAWMRIDTLAGHAYNIGGGPANAISLAQLIQTIERVHGTRPSIRYEPWRAGDQRYYVSNTSEFTAATGWIPRVPASTGIEALYRWFTDQRMPKRGLAHHA